MTSGIGSGEPPPTPSAPARESCVHSVALARLCTPQEFASVLEPDYAACYLASKLARLSVPHYLTIGERLGTVRIHSSIRVIPPRPLTGTPIAP